MHNINFIYPSFFLILILLGISACNESPTAQAISEYERLCNIYEQVISEPANKSPAMIGVTLSERIKNEIPSVFDNFRHIADANRDSAYQLFKNAAEVATQKEWECDVMKSYYAGKFDKK